MPCCWCAIHFHEVSFLGSCIDTEDLFIRVNIIDSEGQIFVCCLDDKNEHDSF